MADLLFTSGTTHIEARCWSCGHTVILTADKLPEEMTVARFERSARCGKCGSGWPQVEQFPKPKSQW